jgi:ATP-dependent Clp protease ATP-binding subunit ClpA
MNLESILHGRVVGQDKAVQAIATSMRRARAGIQNPNRPLGSFLFLGPTGVGKTEISKSLAAAFFGSEEAMTRLDMSEYKTGDALDKLIGSFQGGQTGTLVRSLKQKPYGLLLLDEFEKSTDQVKDLFLQVLDEGVFADMNGKTVSARTSLIIATSNAGADLIWKFFQEGKDPSNFTQDLLNAVIAEGIYKPELLNRFDGVIVFHPLNQEHLQNIASLMLTKLGKRILERKGIEVTFDPEVVSVVAQRGANPQFGARPMNRYIKEHVEQIVADQIINGSLGTGATLHITAKELS